MRRPDQQRVVAKPGDLHADQFGRTDHQVPLGTLISVPSIVSVTMLRLGNLSFRMVVSAYFGS